VPEDSGMRIDERRALPERHMDEAACMVVVPVAQEHGVGAVQADPQDSCVVSERTSLAGVEEIPLFVYFDPYG
jgi:hypothetical protein